MINKTEQDGRKSLVRELIHKKPPLPRKKSTVRKRMSKALRKTSKLTAKPPKTTRRKSSMRPPKTIRRKSSMKPKAKRKETISEGKPMLWSMETISAGDFSRRGSGTSINIRDSSSTAVVFGMRQLTTSQGNVRTAERLAGRYLEISRFPTPEIPGRGKYFKNGAVSSVFTFQGGEKGVFDASQRNERPFELAPILEGDRPVGFTWRFPGEYPNFEARFEVDSDAHQELKDLRQKRISKTTFGKFMGKFSKPGTRRASTIPLAPRAPALLGIDAESPRPSQFQDWQDRFESQRVALKKAQAD